jgi:3-oxoadipate enol-lactonase
MWAVRAAGARRDGAESLIPGILKIWFTDQLTATDCPPVRYVKECFARMSGEGYVLACEALAAADLRPLAPKIMAETLVLCGNEDIPSFLDAAKWLASTLSKARLEWLSPARHCSVLEQPAAFAQLLSEFLG